jgi:fucose 4-O-acetylase-like acetyltransferase
MCFMVVTVGFTVVVPVSVFVRVVGVMRLVAVAAAFAVLVSVSSSTRIVAVTAGFDMPTTLSIFISMLVGMPFVPVGAGFDLFRTVRFGLVRVRHGWLPGSICGLVNTLKPLQGQGRNPEGP